MPEIELGVPKGVVESLPEEEGTAERDMRRAISGIQSRLNEALDEADPGEAAEVVADAVERMESQASTYHEFVPELRAWGQSPIYAIAWRNLYLELIGQLYDHEWLADDLDRERNFRLVEDGIRLSDL
ncbi:hypothetical protein C463_10940 [Halorubrum californiense DSM 19288]|uniref:Uncharacterized protein n=1 Tax=Halorubrum californiense DSM 19288 TaxID=1227465 RepID=M0E5Q1_9EURY|nr:MULTISPECIES: hypothetical protein [Halorubrum]ELZ42383.1 hypothetical protein C463_10940 [Halorubrum californiense DSM 19288]TKX66914.1 hypothetical protein EXE40_15580 [Halorubrum sp. GN11GM_10-3_MGM]